MSSDVTVTLAGFVGTNPRLFTSEHGADYTSFRVAHTHRYRDQARDEWVDGQTIWFTVKVWRGVARNVSSSLRKGDAVVVTGRLRVDEWTTPEGIRTSLVVEATALGPDLTRGEALLRRTVHRRELDGAAAGPDGGLGDIAEAGELDRPGGQGGDEGAGGDGDVGLGRADAPDPWALSQESVGDGGVPPDPGFAEEVA